MIFMFEKSKSAPQRHGDTEVHGESHKQKLIRNNPECKTKESTSKLEHHPFNLSFSLLSPCLRVSVVEVRFPEGSHV